MHLFRAALKTILQLLPYLEFFVLSLFVILATDGYITSLLFVVVFLACRYQFGRIVYVVAWFVVPLIVMVDQINMMLSGLIVALICGSVRFLLHYLRHRG